jgi:hypothetical protein
MYASGFSSNIPATISYTASSNTHTHTHTFIHNGHPFVKNYRVRCTFLCDTYTTKKAWKFGVIFDDVSESSMKSELNVKIGEVRRNTSTQSLF